MKERLRFGPLQMRAADFASRQEERPPSRLRPSSPLLRYLNASLLFASGLLGGMVVQAPFGPAAPQVNIPVYDLFSAENTRGSEDLGLQVRVPEHSQFVLFLHPGDVASYSSYEIDLRDSAGRAAWRGQALKPDAYGALSLAFAGDFLKPGKYQLNLLGRSADKRSFIKAYPMEVVQ
jgi:hypothetical protein